MLERLLSDFGVKLMNRQNDLGLVKIGEFKTHGEAELFVNHVRRAPGVRIPEYNPIHPPRETNVSHLHLNQEADRRGKFTVCVNVGENNPLFQKLPRINHG
jgi:hypothetical protein